MEEMVETFLPFIVYVSYLCQKQNQIDGKYELQTFIFRYFDNIAFVVM